MSQPRVVATSSLPVRGAWIEIDKLVDGRDEAPRRSPCGERGLKSLDIAPAIRIPPSLPVRGAWIEMR